MQFRSINRVQEIAIWNGKQPFGLENIRTILSALGDPQDKVKTIHITGTNGKGSVGAALSSILNSAGYSVGHNPSPELNSITERCLINGAPVGELELDLALAKVFRVAGANNIEPSGFECITAASFLLFAELGVDWIVLEVGVGGRLDATNTVKSSELSILTSVGLDHTQILGNSLEEIAFDKIHISRTHKPAVIGPVSSAVCQVIQKFCATQETPVAFFGKDFTLLDETLIYGDRSVALPLSERRLFAPYQRANVALAAYAAALLGVDPQAIQRGILEYRWPARAEEFSVGNAQIIIDGAHNPAGLEAFFNYLSFLEDRPTTILFSILESKNWQEMLRLLRAWLADREVQFLWTTSGHHNAVDPQRLCDEFGAGQVVQDPDSVIAEVGSVATERLIICGSLYLAGRIRRLLTDQPFRTFAPSSSSITRLHNRKNDCVPAP